MINTETPKTSFFDNTTVHEQDSDSRYYDDKALSRVFEIEHPVIDGEISFAREDMVVKSRTRVMSLSETISGRDEDERWSSFLHTI